MATGEEVILPYVAGRLSGVGILRRNLDNAKLRGLLDYTESRGLLDVTFQVKAVPDVHRSIIKLIKKMNGE